MLRCRYPGLTTSGYLNPNGLRKIRSSSIGYRPRKDRIMEKRLQSFSSALVARGWHAGPVRRGDQGNLQTADLSTVGRYTTNTCRGLAFLFSTVLETIPWAAKPLRKKGDDSGYGAINRRHAQGCGRCWNDVRDHRRRARFGRIGRCTVAHIAHRRSIPQRSSHSLARGDVGLASTW